MDESNTSEEIDLIIHVLQEHEERFEKIEKRLDDIKKLIDYYSPIVNKLNQAEKVPTSTTADVPQNILVVDDDHQCG